MNFFDEDDIVISGIGGRFPEADNLDELRDNLFSGYDMVTSENSRWIPGVLGAPVRTGKMKSLDRCDAQYFGIMRKQCNAIDPVTRQVLERTYEAILDAGLNPHELKGSLTSVFFGSTISETEIVLVHSKAPDGYSIMGRNRALNSNRLSYWLDLKGTSLAFDCTWTSGLQGFELAYNHIRNGLCDAAIVANGNNIVHANASKQYQDLNSLSPEGVTKSFDIDANGYARSEAVSVFLIQKSKDAKRSYGSIVHVLSKSMNNSIGQLIVPKQEDWKDFLEEFYDQCQVNPNQVAFLEADGAALQSSDVPEMNAVAEVFCSERDSTKPLLVGSVKSNLGHAEAAAGSCSVAKVLVATHTGKIPPNLHYQCPNSKIGALVTGQMKVVTEPTPLEGDFLAINAFGIGGTYAHLLIKRPTQPKRLTVPVPVPVPRIVLVSGRSEEGVENALDKIESISLNDEYIGLVNRVYSKNVVNHMHRGFTIVPQLDKKIRGNEVYPGAKRPIWFVFSGMGSQWLTMAKDFMPLPIFRESIEVCHKILLSKGLDLKHIITSDDKTIFDNILHCFVGIAAVQIALVDILKALKIKPDGMIGHSVGETAAGYADGCLTREQMILAAYSRGKASIETPVIKGMMAAIGKGYNQIKDHLPKDVEVACHNASDSCTLSGPAETVNKYVEKLKDEGVFARAVNVANIAYHSKHIAKMGPKLFQYLSKEIPEPKERSSKWVSTSFPEERWDEPESKFCSPQYLTNNLLSPVYFEEGCRHIPSDAILIEIAPHGLLQAILKRSMGPKCTNIALTNRNASNQLHFLFQAIGKMYLTGLQPQVSALYPPIEFPVSAGTPTLAPLATWDHSETWNLIPPALSDRGINNKEFNIQLHHEDDAICKTYKFDGKTTLPCSKYLMLVWEIFASVRAKKIKEVEISFENVLFKKSIEITKDPILKLSVAVAPGTGFFEILKDDDVMVTGYAKEEKVPKGSSPSLDGNEVVIKKEDFYMELLQSGHEYVDPLTTVKKVKNLKNSIWVNEIEWTGNYMAYLESIIQIYSMKASESNGLHYLTRIRKLTIDPRQLLKQNSDLNVVFELDKDILTGPGVYGFGFKFRKILRTPLKLSDGDLNLLVPAIPTSGNVIKISHVEIFGKNIQPPKLGYSGKNHLGQKVIGLGSVDEASLTVRPDEILTWPVPEKWNLDDAATVPVSYTLAYYAIKILGNPRKEDVILIIDGANTFGLACLSVALESENVIHTAVFSQEEKQLLLQKFDKLQESNIFIADKENNVDQFSVDFMMKTNGADLIVSTGSPITAEKSLYLLNRYGKVIEFFSEKCEEGELLWGTVNFLKYAVFYAVNLDTILNLCEEEKKILKSCVNQGIQSNSIVPLPKTVVTKINGISNKQTSQILQLENSDESRRVKPKRFICESGKSCLIIGGETHTWLQISEWFVKRQAKQITVINTDHNLSDHYLHKLKQLNKIAKVTLKSVQSYDSQTLKSILKDSGDLAVAVLLPVEKNGQNLDSSYELLKSFDSVCKDRRCYTVSILKSNSKGVKVCSNRNENGLPTIAVLWDAHINGKTQGFLQILDSLLYQNSKSIIKIKDEYEEKNTLVNMKDALRNSLPRCPEELADYSKSLTEDVRITELRTMSPAMKYIKETLPFFLIPGISKEDRLVQRFHKSLYPSFVVNLPHLGNSSIEEYAAYIVPKLKNTTPGPYILIGDNWGGSIALELARQLECLGERVHVFLLSGTPYEVLEAIKFIGNDLKSLQLGLLRRSFEIDDIKTLQELSNQKTWMNQLNFCTSYIHPDTRQTVSKGLDAIKCRLESLLSYSISRPLNGPLTIITKTDVPAAHIKKLSKEVKIVSVEAENDLLNEEIFTMIHDSCICKVQER